MKTKGIPGLRGFAVAGCLLAAACTAGSRPLPSAATAWRIEAEQPARVSFGEMIDVDAPAGLTLWYPRELVAPVAIEFEALAVSEGGPNDQVSDLNAFWMATEADGNAPLTHGRSGAFPEYDTLKTYYVGIGGNRNTTTRFRRYVGASGDRPLLPEHDLQAAEHLLVPNRWTRIRLIADGARIAVERDGRALFAFADPHPYTRGWFALRTTKSHLRIRNFRIGKP